MLSFNEPMYCSPWLIFNDFCRQLRFFDASSVASLSSDSPNRDFHTQAWPWRNTDACFFNIVVSASTLCIVDCFAHSKLMDFLLLLLALSFT